MQDTLLPEFLRRGNSLPTTPWPTRDWGGDYLERQRNADSVAHDVALSMVGPKEALGKATDEQQQRTAYNTNNFWTDPVVSRAGWQVGPGVMPNSENPSSDFVVPSLPAQKEGDFLGLTANERRQYCQRYEAASRQTRRDLDETAPPPAPAPENDDAALGIPQPPEGNEFLTIYDFERLCTGFRPPPPRGTLFCLIGTTWEDWIRSCRREGIYEPFAPSSYDLVQAMYHRQRTNQRLHLPRTNHNADLPQTSMIDQNKFVDHMKRWEMLFHNLPRGISDVEFLRDLDLPPCFAQRIEATIATCMVTARRGGRQVRFMCDGENVDSAPWLRAAMEQAGRCVEAVYQAGFDLRYKSPNRVKCEDEMDEFEGAPAMFRGPPWEVFRK